MLKLARTEAHTPVLWTCAILLSLFGDGWVAHPEYGGMISTVLFVILLVVVIWGAFGVVRHAEALAERLGEPYGTLILTMAVTLIEVTVIVTAAHHAPAATPLARDSIFAVLMIMLNGIVGLCLLLGGLRHREQSYNLPGTHAFLAVAFPLSIFTLVLPNFTTSTSGPTLSQSQAAVLAVMILSLYGVFLAIQTVRHRGFFQELAGEEPASHQIDITRSTAFHTLALLWTLVPIIYLAETLGRMIDKVGGLVGAPEAMGGVVVAALVLAPESVGALQAALRNRLQRAVNIALGSALATIGLTIPAVLLLGLWQGRQVTLGLPNEEMVLLLTTLLVSILTFSGARTNVLQGAVHVLMFLVFMLLLFDP
jgi:Ca2+:H+ antiporter